MSNTTNLGRRTLLKAALALSATRAVAQSDTDVASVPDAEASAIAELYAAAVAEGGNLVIYAGGDVDSQGDAPRAAFAAMFPDINLDIVVDYSKFHDARVNAQIARGNVIPDVVQLQTIQNFPRWADMDVLERFKPLGFENIYESFKDPDGAWMAVLPLAFSYMYDVEGVGNYPPMSPRNLADPRWKDQIVSSYPHDDDAVLYLYKLYVDTYGWEWLDALVKQNIQFNRGSHMAGVTVNAGEKLIGVGASGTLTAVDAPVRWTIAEDEPFVAWGQRAAIMASARNKSAAKLYMSWATSNAVQSANYNGWSVRTDVNAADGLQQLWEYPNSNVEGFIEFMSDRAEVERWKSIFAVYFGDVEGSPTPGFLGPRPE